MSQNVDVTQKIEALKAMYEVMGRVLGLYYQIQNRPRTMANCPLFSRINDVRKYVEDQWVYLIIPKI